MKIFSKHICYILFSALLITLSGCGKSSGNDKNGVIDVEIQRVKVSDLNREIIYSGNIEESMKIPLTFPVYGTVTRVMVSEGDFVKKGQLLAVLENENYKNALDLATATKNQAEDAYNRVLPMYKNGNIPAIKMVEIETNLKKAIAQESIARKNLADCSLYSTESGIVGKRQIEPGMTSTPNVTSIEIIKIDKVYARVSIPENEIAFIKKGMSAHIKIGALDHKDFTGTVHEIGVMADPMAHTYKIKISVSNPGRVIKPGMICDVTIANRVIKTGYIVQERSVMIDDAGRNYVYIINSSQKAVKKFVKTGNLVNSGIEITGGLNNDDLVVVAGQQKLTDNSSVNIINR